MVVNTNRSSADLQEIMRKLQMSIDQYTNNRNIDGPAFPILITLYSLLIIVGATGNSLVVIAVIRKPIMRTARNMFIVNLAISGKLLILKLVCNNKFIILNLFQIYYYV